MNGNYEWQKLQGSERFERYRREAEEHRLAKSVPQAPGLLSRAFSYVASRLQSLPAQGDVAQKELGRRGRTVHKRPSA